jgi:uncharacterized membrane protein
VRNITIILALLLVPYLALIPVQVTEPIRARVGILSVFVFTSIGHFVKTEAMSRMLPSWTSMSIPLIYITGVFELLAGIAILIPSFSRCAGVVLCLFLVAILPSNIYAAFQRVDFGGHAMGPKYLLIRIPLQLFLIGWIYWFAVRV